MPCSKDDRPARRVLNVPAKMSSRVNARRGECTKGPTVRARLDIESIAGAIVCNSRLASARTQAGKRPEVNHNNVAER